MNLPQTILHLARKKTFQFLIPSCVPQLHDRGGPEGGITIEHLTRNNDLNHDVDTMIHENMKKYVENMEEYPLLYKLWA